MIEMPSLVWMAAYTIMISAYAFVVALFVVGLFVLVKTLKNKIRPIFSDNVGPGD